MGVWGGVCGVVIGCGATGVWGGAVFGCETVTGAIGCDTGLGVVGFNGGAVVMG